MRHFVPNFTSFNHKSPPWRGWGGMYNLVKVVTNLFRRAKRAIDRKAAVAEQSPIQNTCANHVESRRG